MKRVYGALVAGAATANLVACCASPPETPPNPDVKIAFDQISKYWNDRGFSLLGKTKLVTIGEGEVFDCVYADDSSVEIFSDDDGVASYCPGVDNESNTVTVSLDSYNDLLVRTASKGVSAKAAAVILGAHELGHAVQSSENPLTGSSPELELDADCHAALAIGDLYPNSDIIDTADEFYGALPVDGSHGTTEQRIAAFNSGLAKGTC